MRLNRFLPLAALMAAPIVFGQSGLTLESSRSTEELRARADLAVRRFAKNAAAITRMHRQALVRAGRYNAKIPFCLPTFIRTGISGGGDVGIQSGDITLAFDSSGSRAFTPEYRAFLQSVFDQAKPVLNVVFGSPANPSTVFVRNYDSDIGDRDAVAGGYFIPDNGSGQMEIAFPVYNQPESAAVNFIHTLMLAYQGSNPYAFDAFEEGLVRAAVMKVVRTPGSLPNGLDQSLVEQVLDNTYDVSTWYDWYNQRALGGPIFIAPNLRDVPLPPGGSTGGLYLLRYEMAGTIWEKLIADNGISGFIAEFNRRYYQNPSIGNDASALVALGQQVLDFLRPGDPTVEGMSFAQWFKRQYILETENTFGTKLLVQPIPLDPQIGSDDYGPFDIWTHWFETDTSGNEQLLGGTSFPIFWEDTFNRFSTSAQDDRMSIAAGFGDVAPNFPDQVGNPYRVTVDMPVQDQLARVYLPAGAIATAANPVANDFYGTVVGFDTTGGAAGRVQVLNGVTLNVIAEVPLKSGAFGGRLDNDPILQSGSFVVKVIRTVGSLDSDVLVRRVNKGPGPIALDLRVDGDAIFTLPGGLPKGMSSMGLPLEPFSSSVPKLLGLAANDVLAARYNPSRSAYDLFPTMEPFKQGHGYLVRMPAGAPLTVEGRTSPGTPTSVVVRPGWNMISTPINETVATSKVQVIKATDFPKPYADAAGAELGLDFFTFVPGPPDPFTGAPETGTMTAATTFEPGKMYFVRDLAPEGATLLFTPQTSFGPASRSGSGSIQDNSSSGDKWQMKVTISGKDRRETQALVGASKSATEGFDRREDSGLPPGIGGFQVWSQTFDTLYRDMRPVSKPETFTMRIEGLKAGQTYKLQLWTIFGDKQSLDVYDTERRIRRTLPAYGSYSFVASGQSRLLELRAKAGLK